MKSCSPMNYMFCFVRNFIYCLSCISIFCVYSNAQDVLSDDENEENVYILAPFTVETSGDVGYLAQNTTSGSRLNSSLKDTPAAVSVFTTEFMEDIGATDITSLTAYTLNTDRDVGITYDGAPAGNNITASDANFKIRGLPTGGGGERSVNFFGYSIEVDTFNIERVDFSRGPNAILFGLASAGGSFNVSTKKASVSEDNIEINARIGSWDQFRGTMDINKVILDEKLAIRANLLSETKESWRSFGHKDTDRVAMTLRYRPTMKTTFDVEFETGQVDQANHRPWIGQDFISPYLDPNPNPAFSTTLTNPRDPEWVYFPDGNIHNTGRSTFTLISTPPNVPAGVPFFNPITIPQITDFDTVSKEVTVAGSGIGQEVDYYTISAFLQQEITEDFFIELAFNHQDIDSLAVDVGPADIAIHIDPNSNFPGPIPVIPGEVNPNYNEAYVQGNFLHRDHWDRINDLRLTATYKLNLGRWGTHQLVGLLEKRYEYNRELESFETTLDHATALILPENSANYIIRRTYVDLNGPADQIAIADFRDNPIANTLFVPGENNNDDQLKLFTSMIATQSRFWDDRIVATWGYREDHLDAYLSTLGRGDPFGPFLVGPTVPVKATDPKKFKGITRSQGLVFHTTDWLSLFVNHATNFALPDTGLNIIPANDPPAPKGEGWDYGVKFTLMEGRVFATVSKYDTAARDDSVRFGRPFQNNINPIWDALEINGILEAEGVQRDVLFNNGYVFDQDSEGWEVELVANLTDNWRLTANYSHNKTIRKNLGLEVMEYVDRYRDLFLSYPTLSTRPGAVAGETLPEEHGQSIAGRMRNVDNNINSRLLLDEGGTVRGIPMDSFNLRTNYSFHGGLLNGFDIGGGVRWRGNTVAGYTSVIASEGEEVYGNDYTLVDFNIGYTRPIKIGSYSILWSIQLNIENLLDEDDIIVNNIDYDTPRGSGQNIIRNYRLQTPRQWYVTSKFRF